MADLKTYFNNWIHVAYDLTEKMERDRLITALDLSHLRKEMENWCLDNLGQRGLRWDRYNAPRSPNKLIEMYRFKREEDALMFVLTHGGKVISNQ